MNFGSSVRTSTPEITKLPVNRARRGACLWTAAGLLVSFLTTSCDRWKGSEPASRAAQGASTNGEATGISTFAVTEVSLAELKRMGSFIGEVRDKEMKYETPAFGSNRVDEVSASYARIVIKRGDGGHLVVIETHPDTNMQALVHFLERGCKYEFPQILLNWRKQTSD